VKIRGRHAASLPYNGSVNRIPFILAAIASIGFGQPVYSRTKPFPAYRVIGNIYYVGGEDITSYLIVTPKGHIILNSGYEDTPTLIQESVEKLGFKITDVKILLNSQAHFDHVAGQAALQKMSGAKIYSSEREAGVLQSGGKTDPRWGREFTYPPVQVDHTIHDGEGVTLGGITLTAHLTPGHSIGCTTWTMHVTDAGKVYDVVFVGGTSINPGVRLVDHPTYPGIAEDYKATFQTLRSLKCDVFLGAHGGYYDMIEKYKRMQGGAQPNPFIDPEGYRAFVDSEEAHFRDQLSKEKDLPDPK
jgi:metallo-beta-lactamase class B